MNDDLCENIVNHANSIYLQLANMNSQMNENGITNSNQFEQPNTSPSQGLAYLLLILFVAYSVLSFFTPRQQQPTQKGINQQQPTHRDDQY